MGATTPHATFVRPDLGSFCRLDELGPQVMGQRLEPGRAVLACRVIETDEFARWCRRCGCEAAPRDRVTRRLAHEPLGWRPTTLLVTIRRYRCTGCGHVWCQDTSRAAEPRAKLSRRALRWALEGIVCQHLTVARVAEGLGVSWTTANDAVLAEGRRVLIEDPHRFDGVRVIGVEVVAMDGFAGFKTATSEELPDAVAVMDPFHAVRLGGDALDQCRRRVQQATCGHTSA
jgi:transposase